jgi:protein-tyrosine phosphatase
MAEALLQGRLASIGVDAVVTSAGELPAGAPASAGSVRAMALRGVDLDGHVSRTVTPDLVASADLVLAMSRRHLRNAVALRPDAFSRTFTLKELVRRGEELGARAPGQPLRAWLAEVHGDRTPSSLLRDDPADDVDDPIGGPDHLYEATADELADLIDRLVDVAFATQRETA